MVVSWSLALLLLSPPASAAPRTAAADKPTLCGCLRSRVCWGAVRESFGQVFSLKKTEIEGALPGRFFPGTLAWAMPEADKEGRFLTVECGAARVPCRENAETLERRLLAVSLLSALPLPPPPTLYFDPRTWEVRGPGMQALVEAKQCRPTVWDELTEPLKVRAP